MYQIDFHADDYGISVNNSRRIIELVQNGHLNSFSIVANMSCYEECIKLLKESWDSFRIKPLITVHINLMDGYSLSGEFEPTDSWGKLLKLSCTPGNVRKAEFNAICAEIKAQIDRVYSDIRDLPGIDGKLRLDSHGHTHLIPIVFDAMLEAVDQLDYGRDKLVFVRLSREPFWMFITTPGVAGTFPVINAVKNIVLRVLSHRADRILSDFKLPKCLLWGLMMSGRMDGDRISRLLPKMKAYALKRDRYLEIICHPGIVLDEERLPEYGTADSVFFFDEDRNVEYEAMVHCCVNYENFTGK